MFAQTYNPPKTELCQLFFENGSDKCPQIFHSYSEHYFDILKEFRNTFTDVLEIGIGVPSIMAPIVGEKYKIGASLFAWKEFFQESTIYGLDINTESFFDEERIHTFWTDQSNSEHLISTISEIRKFKNNQDLKFDLIIDDGSHIVEHMTLTFITLLNFLKPGGIYIIEDIKKKDITYFESFLKKFENIEMIQSFPGNLEWDGFIAVKKNK